MQMAQSANIIHGSVTLDNYANSITIDVPFEPKLYMISLREMAQDETSYRTFFEIGGFFTNTINVPNVMIGTDGLCYEFDGKVNSARSTMLALPTYSNGQLTLMPRSASQNWCKGTYDYIIAG